MTLQPARPTIGKWSTGQYAGLLRPWVLAGTALLIAAAAIPVARPALAWIAPLLSIGIGWRVGRWGGGRLEALTAGAIAGTLLGIAAAVLRLVTDPGLITGLNLIAETILTALVGAALSTAAALITSLSKN